jgi:hypothetical protein
MIFFLSDVLHSCTCTYTVCILCARVCCGSLMGMTKCLMYVRLQRTYCKTRQIVSLNYLYFTRSVTKTARQCFRCRAGFPLTCKPSQTGNDSVRSNIYINYHKSRPMVNQLCGLMRSIFLNNREKRNTICPQCTHCIKCFVLNFFTYY